MANGNDATALPSTECASSANRGRPVVTVVHSPPPGSSVAVHVQHGRDVRHILSSGGVVAITNYVDNAPTYRWDVESMCRVAKCTRDGALIQWQCAFYHFLDISCFII